MVTHRLKLSVAGAMCLVLPAILAGCGSGEAALPPSASGTVEGREFIASDGLPGTSATDNGAPKVLEGQIRVAFSTGTISASGGCNTLGGAGAINDGTLSVAGPLASTEMACAPALMAQDAWLADLLQSSPVASLEGELLSLVGPTASIVLVDRKAVEPDLPLQGTMWSLTGIIEGEATSSLPSGAAGTIRIVGDRMTVDTGCNTGSATATTQSADPITSVGEASGDPDSAHDEGHDHGVSAGRIAMGPLAMTKRACDGPAAEVERAMLRTLAGPTLIYTISSRTLNLVNPGKDPATGTGLTFGGMTP